MKEQIATAEPVKDFLYYAPTIITVLNLILWGVVIYFGVKLYRKLMAYMSQNTNT